MLKKFLTEPLVHFLLIAVLFFGVYDQLNPSESDLSIITVSEGRIAQIRNNILEYRKREALQSEIKEAAHQYAINEMYLREARAIGMSNGDKVIDRRLRQKMEFMLEDLAAVKAPTDQELREFYRQHIDNYQVPARYSFRQAFISTDRTKQELDRILNIQNNRVQQGQSPEGERSLLPAERSLATSSDIERTFGKGVAEKLAEVPAGKWSSPIRSAMGMHYFFLIEYTPEQAKEYEVAQADVLNDWQYYNSQEVKQSFEQTMQNNYRVDIQWDDQTKGAP